MPVSPTLEQITTAVSDAVGNPSAGAVADVIPAIAQAVADLLDPQPKATKTK